MKTKSLFLTLVLLALGASLSAQIGPASSSTGSITAAGSSCAVTNACIILNLANSNVGYTVTVSGTFTATLQIEQSNDGLNWTAVSSPTAATQYTSALIAGLTGVRVRCSAFTSGTAVVTITAGGATTLQTVTGGSSSSTSTGPVINVTNPIYAGGASSALADNNAAFTAAFAASNALKTVTNPVAPRTIPQTTAVPAATSTITQNVNLLSGDTTYLFVLDSLNQNPSVLSDSAGNTYTQQGASFNTTGGWLRIYRTAIGGTLQASTLTVTENPTEDLTIAVISLPGVLSDSVGTGVTGSSTAPRVSTTTTAANSSVLSVCGWWNNAAITLGAPLPGTTSLATNAGASSTVLGMAMFQAIQGPIGTVTNGGTLSATSPWGCQAIEVKGGGNVNALPTVYVPQGYYYYSGGINPTQPTKFMCEQGAYLHYTGSAHAADIGATGLTVATQQFPFIIDGCTWTGGTNMTQGIFLNSFATQVGIRNSQFTNFGNSSSYAIAGNCENWDIEVGPQNRFLINDYQPRKVFIENLLHCSFDSFVRFHDNNMFCLPAYQNVGCASAQAGVGIVIDGYTNRIYHNNLAFFNPLIQVICSNATTCINNQVDQNQMESVGTGSGTPVIQFSNQDGMLVSQNTILMHATGSSPIGPIGGSDALSGARINFNTISQSGASTPIVQLNNVTGQTGNISYGNSCAVALGVHSQCGVIHTPGSNISPWINVIEADTIGTLSNCNVNSVSPAACGLASSGSVVVPTTTTTYTVNTTAVTANSRITILPITDNSGLTGAPTCIAPPTPFIAYESARVSGTSFTFTLPSTTGTSCWTYWIVN